MGPEDLKAGAFSRNFGSDDEDEYANERLLVVKKKVQERKQMKPIFKWVKSFREEMNLDVNNNNNNNQNQNNNNINQEKKVKVRNLIIGINSGVNVLQSYFSLTEKDLVGTIMLPEISLKGNSIGLNQSYDNISFDFYLPTNAVNTNVKVEDMILLANIPDLEKDRFSVIVDLFMSHIDMEAVICIDNTVFGEMRTLLYNDNESYPWCLRCLATESCIDTMKYSNGRPSFLQDILQTGHGKGNDNGGMKFLEISNPVVSLSASIISYCEMNDIYGLCLLGIFNHLSITDIICAFKDIVPLLSKLMNDLPIQDVTRYIKDCEDDKDDFMLTTEFIYT